MRDTLNSVRRLCPAASANVDSASIDIGPAGGSGIQKALLLVDVDALPALGNTETLTITIQDSADNVSFAAAVGYSTIVITGPASGGSPAQSIRRAAHPGLRRYVRVNLARSSGGNVTAQGVTFGVEI